MMDCYQPGWIDVMFIGIGMVTSIVVVVSISIWVFENFRVVRRGKDVEE